MRNIINNTCELLPLYKQFIGKEDISNHNSFQKSMFFKYKKMDKFFYSIEIKEKEFPNAKNLKELIFEMADSYFFDGYDIDKIKSIIETYLTKYTGFDYNLFSINVQIIKRVDNKTKEELKNMDKINPEIFHFSEHTLHIYINSELDNLFKFITLYHNTCCKLNKSNQIKNNVIKNQKEKIKLLEKEIIKLTKKEL